MKNLVIILTIFFCAVVHSHSQIPGKFIYSASVGAPSMGQAALYKASLDWFALNGNPKKAFIKLNDATEGHFSCITTLIDSVKYAAAGSHYAVLPAVVSYSINFDTKPGSSTITIIGLRYKYYLPPDSYVNDNDKGRMVDTTFDGLSAALNRGEIPPARMQSLFDFLSSCDMRFKAIIESYRKQISQAVSGGNDGF